MTRAEILWVDDEPETSESIQNFLIRAGYQITVAASLTEAMTELESKRFDIIALDAMMPAFTKDGEPLFPETATSEGRDTGVAFFEKNRDDFANWRTAVLAFTSRWDVSIEQKFVGAGLPGDRFLRLHRATPHMFLQAIEKIIAAQEGNDE